MDKDQKVLQLIEEYEAEAARCTRIAQELRKALGAQGTGAVLAGPATVAGIGLVTQAPKTMHTNGPSMSTLVASLTALKEKGATHIKDLQPLVSELRGVDTPRASIESVLVRAIKERKHGVARTAPATFALRF